MTATLTSRRRHGTAACLAVAGIAFALMAIRPSPAWADIVTRESDIAGLRLGQHVLVDDASCPSGQIKEVTGMRLVEGAVARSRKCVDRKAARR